MSARNSRQTAFTLVEAAVFISLIGVLLAASVPTFVRAIRTSKMAEASHELSRIYAATAAYYATPQFVPAAPASPGPRTLATTRAAASKPAEPAGDQRLRCVPSAAGPTPEKPSSEPAQIVFGAPDTRDSATWRALGYEPSGAIRYRYSFLPAASGCGVLGEDSHGEVVLSVRAEGDLDGDGVLSSFERRASVQNGDLVLDPLLVTRDRVE